MTANSLDAGVYWAARDLATSPLGNHHMLILVAARDRLQEVGVVAQTEETGHFCTLAGYISAEGRLVFTMNHTDDLQAVREYVNPDEHTSALTPDLDLEPHKVDAPDGDEAHFLERVAQLALNYKRNTAAGAPKYSLLDSNCSSWVNTLLLCADVSKSQRTRLGEFLGFDWGEEDVIDTEYFND